MKKNIDTKKLMKKMIKYIVLFKMNQHNIVSKGSFFSKKISSNLSILYSIDLLEDNTHSLEFKDFFELKRKKIETIVLYMLTDKGLLSSYNQLISIGSTLDINSSDEDIDLFLKTHKNSKSIDYYYELLFKTLTEINDEYNFKSKHFK